MLKSYDINVTESIIIDTDTGTALRFNSGTGEYRIVEDASMWREVIDEDATAWLKEDDFFYAVND